MRRRGRRVVLVMNLSGSSAARIREIASSEPGKAEPPTYTTPSRSSRMPLTTRASPRIAEVVPCCIDIFLARSMRILRNPCLAGISEYACFSEQPTRPIISLDACRNLYDDHGEDMVELVPSANLGDVWVRTLDNLANVGPRPQRSHLRKKSSQPLLFFVL